MVSMREKLSGYPRGLAVYEASTCPHNESSWRAAAINLGCTLELKSPFTNIYYCIPNQAKSRLVEFCYDGPSQGTIKGVCQELDDNGHLQDSDCTHFKEGCPEKKYLTETIYNYKACLLINTEQRCYLAEEECLPSESGQSFQTTAFPDANFTEYPFSNSNNTATSDIHNTTAVIVSVIIAFLLIIVLAVVIWCLKKRKNKQKQNEEEDVKLMDQTQPEVQSKTEVSLEGLRVEREKTIIACEVLLDSSVIKSIQWTKNGRLINTSRSQEKYSGGTKKAPSLIIKNLDTADIADYRCRICYNMGETESQTIRLDIDIKINGNTKVKFGKQAEIKGSITSGPDFRLAFSQGNQIVKWIKKNDNLEKNIDVLNEKYAGSKCSLSSPILVINKADFADIGTYQLKLQGLYSNVLHLSVFEEQRIPVEKIFCKTTVYEKVKNLVLNNKSSNRIITIAGDPGCGKTAIAHQIGYEISNKGWETIYVSKIDECITKKQNKRQMFICDDPFGVHGFQRQKMTKISLSNLKSYTSDKNFKLVMTCRKTILNEAKPMKLFIFGKVIDMTLDVNKLDRSEKEKILSEHCKHCNIDVSPVMTNLTQKDNEMFPLLCLLYSANIKYRPNGYELFSNPTRFFQQDFDKLKESDSFMYKSLVLCMLNNNALSIDKLYKSCDEMIQDVFESVHVEETLKDEIRRKLELAYGTYISDSHRDIFFTFIHDSMFESIAIHYGKCQSKVILKYLNSSFISHRVQLKSLSGEDDDDHFVILPDDGSSYQCLAERLYKDIRNSYLYDVFRNKCWSDPNFQKTFRNFLKRLSFEDLKNVFLSNEILHSSISAESNQFQHKTAEWKCQELLIDRMWNNKTEFTYTKNALGWIILYRCLFLLEFILNEFSRNNECFDEIFGKTIFQQTRFLVLSCFSGDLGTVELVLEHVNEKCINSKCISDSGGSQNNHHRMIVPLDAACQVNNLEIVKFLFKKGAKLSASDLEETLIYHSISCRQNELFCCLIQQGANIKMKDITERNLLNLASFKGSFIMVQQLVDAGIQLNEKDKFLKSPLHNALDKALDTLNSVNTEKNSHEEYFKIAEYLLEKGADVDIWDKNDESPLYQLFKIQRFDIIKLLVEKGLDVNHCDKNDASVLHHAVLSQNSDIVKLLLNQSHINKQNKQGQTALHLACENENEKIVQDLIQNKADVNSRNNVGLSPLYVAAHKGYLCYVEMLSKLTNDVSVDNKSNSLLHHAVMSQNVDVVRYSISQGCDINCKDNSGKTALCLACERGKIEIVENLIESKADVNLTEMNGLSPLHFAAINKNLQFVKKLVEWKANLNTFDNKGASVLHYALINSDNDIVDYILSHYCDFNQMHCKHSPKCNINLKDNQGRTVLYYACEKGNFKIVEHLTSKADLNLTDNRGLCPLYAAVQNGNLKSVEILINNKAKLDVIDSKGISLLQHAVHSENFKIVQSILNHPCNINHQDGLGKTALYVACEKRNFEIVQLIINCNADVNLVDNMGLAPLHKVLDRRNPDLKYVQLLINKQAHMNLLDNKCASFLHYAVLSLNCAFVDCILKCKCDINHKDIQGRTALYLACEYKNYEIAERLINSHADVNLTDNMGLCPLHLATKNGNLSIVQILVKKEANVNVVDNNRISVLHYAVESQNIEIVECILNSNCDTNHQDLNGKTALYRACEKGKYKIVECLIKYQANLNLTDRNGRFPLHVAAENGDLEIFKMILQLTPKVEVDRRGTSILHNAVLSQNIDIVKRILCCDSNINHQDITGRTSLIIACGKKALEIVKILVYHGANVNLTDKWGLSALHVAARNGNIAVFEFLLDNGACLGIVDKHKDSVLHHAVLSKDVKMIDYILNINNNVNLKNTEERTALHLACQRGNSKIVKHLIKKNADVNMTDREKCSPLHLSAKNGHLPCIEILVKNQANLQTVDSYGASVLHYAVLCKNREMVEYILSHSTDINLQDKEESTALYRACENGNEKIVECLINHDANVNLANNM